MAANKLGGAEFRERRRWSFAGCIFDEANWTLLVHGRRVAIETKPLELLRVLLLRAGDLVSKDELLDAVWPDVAVVEASLPTAVRKLRCALDDDNRDTPVIETVPRIGYRLAVPVSVEDIAAVPSGLIAATSAPAAAPEATAAAALGARRRLEPAFTRSLSILGGLALAAAAGVVLFLSQGASASKAERAFAKQKVEKAIRTADLATIEKMIAAGWDPGRPWDKEGNDALSMLLNRCEWYPGHDRRQMLMMARTLIEGGAPIDRRNVFGDTAYSIAKAERYCGPDHPVTQMLEAMCYGGDMGPKDRCLATYELTAAQRQAQGLPPKG